MPVPFLFFLPLSLSNLDSLPYFLEVLSVLASKQEILNFLFLLAVFNFEEVFVVLVFVV